MINDTVDHQIKQPDNENHLEIGCSVLSWHKRALRFDWGTVSNPQVRDMMPAESQQQIQIKHSTEDPMC